MQVLEQITLPDSIIADVAAHSFYRTALLTTAQEFDRLQDEWDELLADSAAGRYFLRWHWNRVWWDTYAPRDSHLFLITCRNEDGQLIGLAPFYWRQHHFAGLAHLREILFLGTGTDIKTSEYLNLLARRGDEQIVAQEIARFLQTNTTWDRLRLWGMVSDTPITQHFRLALGAKANVSTCDFTRHVNTDTDWETFRQTLGAATRKKVPYLYRRLFKTYQCEFRRIENLAELNPVLDALIHLHQLRWESKGEAGSFRLPNFERFLRKITAENLRTGHLRLWTLTVEGQIASAQIAFFERGIAHIFQGGFDPAYPGIGNVIFWLCIKDCIEAPEVREFDFMGGGAEYKSLWTKLGRELIELELCSTHPRAQVYERTINAGRWGRALMRQILPQSIRKKGYLGMNSVAQYLARK